MRRSWQIALPALLSGAGLPAFAQSSVTLYGIVDQSIRYTSNANADNDGLVQLTNGALTNSRWGIKGSEALGGGMQAIFQLENGFDPDTGRANQNNALFGRQAYVGLAGTWGTVALGRQNTEGWTFSGDFDPLGVGNYPGNSWAYSLDRIRSDNAVSYTGRFGGVNVGASYGFGETPGSLKPNQYWGTHATYLTGRFGVGAVYQEMRDAQGSRQQMWSAAGRYTIGNVRLFLAYIGGKDRSGAIDNDFLNDPSRGIVVTRAQAAANPRKDAILVTGLAWQATPSWHLSGAFYYGDIDNKNGIAGNGGKRYTGVILAEYSLSRRTQLYGTVDYNRVTGGAVTELPGKNNQTGVAAGIRHIF
jgi:predicted porin